MTFRYLDDFTTHLRERPPTPATVARIKQLDELFEPGNGYQYLRRPRWEGDPAKSTGSLEVPETYAVSAPFDDIAVEGILGCLQPVPARATELIVQPGVRDRIMGVACAKVAGFAVRGDDNAPANCAIWVDGDKRILEVVWFGLWH